MTKNDLIQMAYLAGYDVDEDEVYAPASGRNGLDPRLEHFAKLVAGYALRYECRDVSTKLQNSDTSAEPVHASDIRKAGQMALDALVEWKKQAPQYWDGFDVKAVKALRQALAQPQQEPVAWMYVNEDGECEQIEYGVSTVEAPYITLLYTAPPSKPWVGLENIDFQYQPPAEVITMKYAEAILKEKNK